MSNSLLNSQKLLIVSGNRINNADYLALYALTNVLIAAGKKVTLAKTKPLPEKFVLSSAVAHIAKVEPRKYTLSFPKGNTAVKDVQWQQDETAINLEISLQSGSISELPQISTSGSDYDTVLYFGTANFEEIAEIFSDFPAFVGEARQISFNQIMSVPQAETEIIGAQTPMSTGELVFNLFSDQIQTPDLSTKLLASIVSGTGRFKHDNVTPKTFQICADLITRGADIKQANAVLDQLFGNESKPGKPENKASEGNAPLEAGKAEPVAAASEQKADTPNAKPEAPAEKPAAASETVATPEVTSAAAEPAANTTEPQTVEPVVATEPVNQASPAPVNS